MFFFSILFSPAVYAEDSTITEESITTFTENWTFSLFLNFNSGIFTQSETSQYRTNKPWNIGLGIRYKMFSFSTSFSIPVTDSPLTAPSLTKPSLDFEFASYLDKMYFEAYFKYYQDYYVSNTEEPIGLDTILSGMTATFVQNHKNHSMSAVNELNKKQNISSGSFLYSLGAFYSSLYSTSEIINDYKKRQNLLYFGPGLGYSYIWVFENGLFLNTSLVLFMNAGFNISTDKWLFIPHLEPNFVFGYHQDTWSTNIKVTNKTTVLLGDTVSLSSPDELDYNLLTLMTISLMFSKRF
jgi:hypothetical protein